VGRNPTPPSLRRGQALGCCLSPELGRAEACEGGPTPPSLRRGQLCGFPPNAQPGRAKAQRRRHAGRATASRRVSQNNGAQGLTALSSVWLKPSEQMGFRSQTEEGCIALPALAHGGPTRFSWRLRTVAATKFYSASCCSADSASALRSFIAALRLSLTRPFSSIPIHFTQTRSPIFTTSSTFLTLKSASSEI
jgi:hypothetical protein